VEGRMLLAARLRTTLLAAAAVIMGVAEKF
jgi:hypothetical protein